MLSPLQPLDDDRLAAAGLRLFLKRDDLIHPDFPGNKWRKLKYNLEAARNAGHTTLLTFGGAYSSHLRATAAAGHHFQFQTIGVVRGEQRLPLNPVLTVGRQIGETLRLHQRLDRGAAERRAIEMLTLVGIPEPERRVDDYPHQLSGGMRQRVMIAMALACSPKLLIADEPTTALDVTVQAQILDLMRDLKRRVGAAIPKLGVKCIIRGMPVQTYEKGIKERVVIVEFDSVQKAMAAHDSPEYAEALKALGDGADRDMRVVEGVA